MTLVAIHTAVNTARVFQNITTQLASSSMGKPASGSRIARAADAEDPALSRVNQIPQPLLRVLQ
jgi:hypothetical protein